MKIEVLDLQFQGVAACVASFLLHAPQGPVLIECGPSSTREALMQELKRRGLQPGDIQAVLVTHIHLDHAGAAGWWAAQGAPIYVHHLGAPHLYDPSKLLASATRIYGDRMDTLWGEVLPVPQELIRAIEGDAHLEVAGLSIQALETPGHARHHYAFQIDDVIFTGDVAAVKLPGQSTFISVPAPPPEFDLEAWTASLDKLLERKASRLYLTHFGAVDTPQIHLQQLRDMLPGVANFVGERRDWEHERLVEAYYQWHRELGMEESVFQAYEKANPLFMSVDGLLRYWKKKTSAAQV